MKGIVRVLDPRTNAIVGFQARRYVKPRETKFFSCAKHDGVRRACAAAIAWLRNHQAQFGEHLTERRVLRAPTRTGEPPGVYRASCFGRDGWMAAWTDRDGALHRKWFGVERYGAEALREAALWRMRAEKQVHGAVMPATRYAADRKRLLRG